MPRDANGPTYSSNVCKFLFPSITGVIVLNLMFFFVIEITIRNSYIAKQGKRIHVAHFIHSVSMYVKSKTKRHNLSENVRFMGLRIRQVQNMVLNSF